MLPAFKLRACVLAGPGSFLFGAGLGLALARPDTLSRSIGAGSVGLGIALLVVGSTACARGRGHSGWLGLFGILGPLGFLIAATLPDRSTRLCPACADPSRGYGHLPDCARGTRACDIVADLARDSARARAALNDVAAPLPSESTVKQKAPSCLED